jgi:hypothetical protein
MVRDKVAKKSGDSMAKVEFSSDFPTDSHSLPQFRSEKPIVYARSSSHVKHRGTGLSPSETTGGIWRLTRSPAIRRAGLAFVALTIALQMYEGRRQSSARPALRPFLHAEKFGSVFAISIIAPPDPRPSEIAHPQYRSALRAARSRRAANCIRGWPCNKFSSERAARGGRVTDGTPCFREIGLLHRR